MRRFLYVAFAATLAAFTFSFYYENVSAQSRLKSFVKPTSGPSDADRSLAADIRKLTDSPDTSMRKVELEDGGTLFDMGGGFQNVMLARLDENANAVSACITSLDEANSFFGRNLETGARVAQTDAVHESLATVAARHGMSEQEFLFYSKLAAEASQHQINLSPQLATITINNLDGAGEGFNDATAAAATPEGGNTGTTLGQQRLNVFNQAAAVWSSNIDTAVPIVIDATFDPLACSPTGAVLGSAGSRYSTWNFPNAPFTNTTYPAALANKIAGTDISSANDDILAQFNSSIDTGCFGGTRFYYGFDSSTPAGTTNLFIVVLHELGHGLGFSSGASTLTVTTATNASPITVTTNANHGLVNGESVTIQGALGNTAANGTFIATVMSPTSFQLNGTTGNGAYTANSATIRGVFTAGLPSIWSRMMYDRTATKFWNTMNTAERAASSVNAGNLLWDGASVKLGSGSLTAGREAATGRVQLYTPSGFVSGSSVSHWDTAATPNLLMEPNINTGLPLTLDLTRQLMRDIGWYRDTTADTVRDSITNVAPSGGNAIIGSSKNITWTNNGSFAKNVTLELSTDGGTTFTAIATDIANTGSYAWTVPNSPSVQGRIRVREADFADPVGISATNFVITAAPTAASAGVSGRVFTAEGFGVAGALVTVSGDNGVILTGRTNAFGYYAFNGLTAGRTYVLQASRKSYSFQPRAINLSADLTDLDIVADAN